MGAPDRVDPVLAFLDFVEGYRRDWRCWLIGGPAALDDLALYGAYQTAGVRLYADFECEATRRVVQLLHAPRADGTLFYDSPRPTPPAPGSFVEGTQTFPLTGTQASATCHRCRGTGERRCPACRGTGTGICAICGGRGWPECSGLPGSHECRECEGKGYLPCDCGDTRRRFALLRHDAMRYTYFHIPWTCEALLPSQAPRREVAGLFRGAWRSKGLHVSLEAGAFPEVGNALRDAGVPDAEHLIHALSERYRHTSRLDVLLGRETTERESCRLLFQRLRAEVAHAASVRVGIGDRRGRYWAVGTGRAYRQGFRGLNGTLGRDFFGALAAGTAAYNLQALQNADFALMPMAALALGFWTTALAWPTGREIWDPPAIRGNHLKHWWRSLRSRPDPTWMVLGPDARASALLFSLFAHLAAHAQLDDATQGGTVTEDTYIALPALLEEDVPEPECSSTYQIHFGEAVGHPPRVRMLHALAPLEEGPGELCRRAIRRAEGLWLVLPAAAPSVAADEWAAEVISLARKEGAPVVLVLDGAPDAGALEHFPATREALTHRPHRVWAVDLAALRDRYLACALPAEEAAAVVAWLADLWEMAPAPALPAADALPEPPAVLPAPGLRLPPREAAG